MFESIFSCEKVTDYLAKERKAFRAVCVKGFTAKNAETVGGAVVTHSHDFKDGDCVWFSELNPNGMIASWWVTREMRESVFVSWGEIENFEFY